MASIMDHEHSIHNLDENDVVISGFSGRFPMSDNIDELSKNLFSKADLIQPQEEAAWKKTKLQVPKRVGQICKKNKFDAGFFGIHRKYSTSLDIMTRLILERTYEAIIDAGLSPQDVTKTNTTVIVSASLSESETSWLYGDFHSGLEFLGHSRAMLANRVSFWLNINASSFAITSMETGGIKALTIAYEALKTGRFDAAIIGAIGLVFLPEISHHFKGLGFLSPDGKTRSFDAAANGYARSDGVAVLFLQRAKDAKRIYASVVHSAFNYYGDRMTPFVRPLVDPFTKLLQSFYETCKVDPASLQFLEAEGAGIKLWDEVELNAVDKVLLPNRKTPLLVGSVKSNLGHSLGAANLFSIAKVLVAMQTGKIPPNINFKNPLPTVPALREGRIKIITNPTSWSGGLVGLNGISMSGNYGHVLLKSFEREKQVLKDNLPRLVLVSGRTQDGLDEALNKLESTPMDVELVRLLHDVFSSHTNNHLYRAYTIVPTGGKPFREVQYYDFSKRPIWFVFSGMGSQWPGMGKELLKIPVCAATLEKCHAILAEKGLDLKHIITTDDASIFDTILHCFVGIAAIQLALVDLLTVLGIKPEGMVGHSVGELGCSYADGCFTLEQMILASYYRGLASIQAKLIQGSMAAIGLGHRQIKDRLPPEVDVACHNSDSSSTLSGPSEPLKKFVDQLQSEGVFARVVNVANIAYHSRYIQPAAPLLLNYLQKIIPEPKKRSSRWVCSSVPEDKWNTPLAQHCSADYHTNNLLSPVLFEESSRHIPKNAITIEIAPHGLLQAILRRSLGPDCTNIPLTQRGHPQGLHFLLSAIGKIYTNGPIPEIHKIYPSVQYPVSRGTPSIAPFATWDHDDDWHVLNDIHISDAKSGEADVTVSLSQAEDRVYAGHIIDGQVRYPTFAYLNIVWRMLALLQDTDYRRMPVVFEDVRILHTVTVPEHGTLQLYVMLLQGSGEFEISHENTPVVTGKITEPENIKKEFIKEVVNPDEKNSISVDGSEVYQEMEQRGYQYRDHFTSIHKVKFSHQGSVATVQWTNNWVVLAESLLQLVLLHSSENDQSLQVVSSIQKIVINPVELPSETKEMEAVFHHAVNVVCCGGLEVRNVSTIPVKLSTLKEEQLKLETINFTKHLNPQLKKIDQFVDICMQLTMENCYRPLESSVVLIVELVNSTNSHLNEHLKAVLPKYPQARLKTIRAGSSNLLDTEEKSCCYLVAVTSREVLKEAQSLLQNGFLLVSSGGKETWPTESGLVTVAEYSSGGRKFTLLRNVFKPNAYTAQVLHAKGDIFTCLDHVKTFGISERLYIVAEVSPFGVGMGPAFLKKLLSEPEFSHVRCVFLSDKSVPPFSLHEEFYLQQLRLDLISNVHHGGAWGGYYTLSLNLDKSEEEHNVDSELLSINSIGDIKLQYLGLNTKNMDINEDEDEADKRVGLLEYSGRSSDGKRVMGIASRSEDDFSITKAQHLLWEIPNTWSMEEATSVPFAYSIAYYSLILTARVQQGESVLVQAGWSNIGQATIALALDNGCNVFTTVKNQAQKMFIKRRFPKILDRHILGLENVALEILSNTKGKGMNVVINTISDGNINTNVRCLAKGGRFIQLATKDLLQNINLGMEIFLNSVAFYGVGSESLFSMGQDMEKALYSGLDEKIRSGVIQPLQRSVFPLQQTQQALRLLFDGNHFGKVLLSVASEEKPVNQHQIFRCSPHNSYLVSGGKAEQCVSVAEWLVLHGARRLVLALYLNSVSNQVKRRINLLKEYHNTQAMVVPTTAVTSEQSATTLIQKATSAVGGELDAIFILPAEDTGEENSVTQSAVYHLDKASRKICTLQHFVCLLSEKTWATCEARHKEGLPAVAVHWADYQSKDFNFRRSLQVLDSILTQNNQDPVIIVRGDKQDASKRKGLSASSLDTFLPSTLTELAELGDDVESCSLCSLEELPSLSPRMEFVKETPPVFIVPGIQGCSAQVLQPLVRNIMFPVFCVKLPSKSQPIPQVAAELVKHVQKVQEEGPYNLVGVSWGGALAVELAKRLEALGEETRVILIDGAPQTALSMIKLLGDGLKMQTTLICRLLHIKSTKVLEELKLLPDWSSQVTRGLSEVPEEVEEVKEVLRTGVMTVADRISTLLQYQYGEVLLNGKITLIQPTDGGGNEDICGLTQVFKNTVNVHMVEGNHRTILSSRDTSTIINSSVL